jgi:hypothetical protein
MAVVRATLSGKGYGITRCSWTCYAVVWKLSNPSVGGSSRGRMSNWSEEETDEPLIADHRNFYKVEKWSRDGQRVVELLFAGSSLEKAKRVFVRWAKHRPRIRMTIRQRLRVLDEWPPHETSLRGGRACHAAALGVTTAGRRPAALHQRLLARPGRDY